jgi:hypothetical protein
MPNHVHNELRISGDRTLINKLNDFVKSPKDTPTQEKRDFDFNQIIPQPRCVFAGNALAHRDAFSNRDWYTWNIEHWDTKWNAYDCELDRAGQYVFSTAWSAPLRVIAALSWLFPELTFTLHHR